MKNIKSFNEHINESKGGEEEKFNFKKAKATVTYYKKNKAEFINVIYDGKELIKNVQFKPSYPSDRMEIRFKKDGYSGKFVVRLFDTKKKWQGGKFTRDLGMTEFQAIEWNVPKAKYSPPIPTPDPDPINLEAENFFDHDSAKLKPEGAKKLEEISGKITKPIKVDGYASIEGNAEHNKELSKNRAVAVAKFLKAKGVTIKGATGHGGTEKFGKGEENYPKNRRVVITFL